jgi:hypothetical protein
VTGRIYQSGLHFVRTQAERDDPLLAWCRPDRAFFAAGACHILAWAFLNAHRGSGFRAWHIRPTSGHPGQHVFVSDGRWALDAGGWTPESVLLDVTSADYRVVYPGWACAVTGIGDMRPWCTANRHRLPEQFPRLPWRRAHRYLRELGA